jgi:membrane protein involved in colicin uptake
MRWIGGICFALCFPATLVADEAPLTLSSGLELYQPREDASPEALEVYSAYQEARQLESEIVRMYREIRAAELTLVQRQTLKRSLDSVLMPLSDRAEVDPRILNGGASTAEEVGRYQQELAVVMRETDAIVSNAQDLLESLLGETESETPASKQEEREQREETQTEQEPRAEQEAQQPQTAEQAREAAASEEQRQAERERREKQAEEALKTAEFHLAKALEEIQAAREEVAEEKKAAEENVETEAKESNEATEAARKKLEQLEALEAKIDAAEEAVQVVAEKVKAMEEASKVEVEEAEAALEAMREAMAAVARADTAAKEASGESTKEKTAQAVREMEAASSSMESAVNALKSTDGSSDGDGGGGSDIARKQALGELAKEGSGKWLDLTAQMRGLDLEITPGETPVGERPEPWAGIEELERTPTARKFSAATPKDTWIFIGDWHVLGRYDNEGRANIQKVYPPESIVDLNAQYLSEDGRTLRWEYESYLPPMVVPHAWESWKIYYFHTELMFEEETEAWLAIGSDDRSDLWINGLPVWHSANRHKGWNPAEGFRKVVFKKGRNQVLLRLENGHAGLGFSVFLNLPPG